MNGNTNYLYEDEGPIADIRYDKDNDITSLLYHDSDVVTSNG